jgi:tRNA pseudouridine55 synthase
MQPGGTIREFCHACEGSSLDSKPKRAVKSGKDAIVGILNVDKPVGLTSHDVVDRVRRASGVRRVGHAGTLDPAASGVLLVCLGQATRVTEYLMDTTKRYDAEIRLGISTDSGDSEGMITYQAPEVEITPEQIEQALSLFLGRIEQIPPMHSALKHEGTALYKLARQGIEVERTPRLVEIYHLEFTAWTPPLLRLTVECSKGTYIRALATDLGQKLGTGAHLQRLVRLASGSFTLEEAVSLATVEESFAEGYWSQILHPLDEALLHYEAVTVDEETEKKIRQGQRVKGFEPPNGPLCRAYSSSGRFIALLRYDQEKEVWQPRKVFNLYADNT